MIDGKGEQLKPPVTGNQRLVEEMKTVLSNIKII
jgi:hypothetical protein